MNSKQIIVSVFLTIFSLVVGYYLNVLANRRANKVFIDILHAELDIIDSHYERLLVQSGNIDEPTKEYLKARREYLNTKIKSIERMHNINRDASINNMN